MLVCAFSLSAKHRQNVHYFLLLWPLQTCSRLFTWVRLFCHSHGLHPHREPTRLLPKTCSNLFTWKVPPPLTCSDLSLAIFWTKRNEMSAVESSQIVIKYYAIAQALISEWHNSSPVRFHFLCVMIPRFICECYTCLL